MDFDYNEKTLEHKEKLESFMEDNVYPAEPAAEKSAADVSVVALALAFTPTPVALIAFAFAYADESCSFVIAEVTS